MLSVAFWGSGQWMVRRLKMVGGAKGGVKGESFSQIQNP